MLLSALTLMVWLVPAPASPAAAQAAEEPSRTFQGRDLFGLRTASDPQVSPDGRAIAYVRVTQDIMTDKAQSSIWLVDPVSGVQRPLVVNEAENTHPRWSPDGSRLAYVVSGAHGAQIYVRWIAAGTSAKVANLEESPSDMAWSPDGKTLAFCMLTLDKNAPLGSPMVPPAGASWAEPLKVIERITYRRDGTGYLKSGYRHLFVVSADGGQPRQLSFGKFEEAGRIAFMPDGKHLLYTTNRAANWERDPQEKDIYEIAVADGAITRLTDRIGPDTSPAPSPDGSKIAYVGFDQRHRGYENVRLYVMDSAGTNPHVITGGLDRSVGSPAWAADGKSIYVDYTDRGVAKVARVGLDGHMTTVATGLTGVELDRPYAGGQWSVSKNGMIAFTLGDTSTPPELAVSRGGTIQQLTHLNADLFADKTLAKVAVLPVTSSFDTQPIDAWIVTPPDFDRSKKYPLILEIHGGPLAAYGPAFATDIQLYAAAGYVVVYANPRGSTSYGEAFANTIDRDYPSHDFDDLMSVVDASIATGFVDSARLYVTGGSGGGVLSTWIVGKTDRFKAAAAQKPAVNWTSEILLSGTYTEMATSWFAKLPWEDPQTYWAHSPLSLVGSVKTPTLLLVGEEDYTTPPPESEQFFAALQLREVPTALVRIPGASHNGLADRPSQSVARVQAILAWFDRYR